MPRVYDRLIPFSDLVQDPCRTQVPGVFSRTLNHILVTFVPLLTHDRLLRRTAQCPPQLQIQD